MIWWLLMDLNGGGSSAVISVTVQSSTIELDVSTPDIEVNVIDPDTQVSATDGDFSMQLDRGVEVSQ